MSLEEKLAEARAMVAARIPLQRRIIMERATAELRKSGMLARIAPVGRPAPVFELANHDGQRVSSAELLAGGPLVLSFFRGSW
jgi:hypothetical protein